MTDSRIETGALVHYTHLGVPGVGRVKESGGSPLMEFWDGQAERKDASSLTPLGEADAGPVGLLWDEPAALGAWAKDKPLKLTALALLVGGGRGNPAQIKGMLEQVPLGADWKVWWGKRVKSLNALAALPEPEHFSKSVKGNEYVLVCGVGAVPDDAQAPVSLADWKGWLGSEVKLPTFGKNPSKILCESLAEWPGDSIELALNRILWGAGLFLDAPKKPSAAGALAWMDAVGSAARRWTALYPDDGEPAERSGEVLARLSKVIQVKEKRKEATLFWAGALSEGPDRERQLEELRGEGERLGVAHAAEVGKMQQEWERERDGYVAELKGLRRERERLEAAHVAELESLRGAHAAALEGEWRTQERLRKQIQTLDAQMASGREESRLEVRQGMLLAVGDALQRAYVQGKKAEDRLGVVITTLPKALQEGGAETLGKVGEIVKYNPKFHHSPEAVSSGIKVRLTAPGVVVGDRVILKASVSTEGEVC